MNVAKPEPRVEEQVNVAKPDPRVEEQLDLAKPLMGDEVDLAKPLMGDEGNLAEPLMGEEVLAESLVDVLGPRVEVESTTPPSNNKWSEF